MKIHEKYLSQGWNNGLTYSLGLLTLAYALLGISTTLGESTGGFVGLFLLGAVY